MTFNGYSMSPLNTVWAKKWTPYCFSTNCPKICGNKVSSCQTRCDVQYHVTMNAYLSGLIYYVCNSTHQYQSAHQFDVSSFTQCKDTIVAQNLKMGIYYVCNSTHQYQSAHKFDVSSVTQCKDTIVAQNLKMGNLNLITPLSGMVCHPQARNWYNRLCQIWSL